MLYLAMLRAAGLTAYAIKWSIATEASSILPYLSLDQLDSTLVDLSTGRQTCPARSRREDVPVSDRELETFRCRRSGPEAQRASPSRYSDAAIQGQCHAAPRRCIPRRARRRSPGHINIVMTGQEALHWRQRALERRRHRTEEAVRPRRIGTDRARRAWKRTSITFCP